MENLFCHFWNRNPISLISCTTALFITLSINLANSQLDQNWLIRGDQIRTDGGTYTTSLINPITSFKTDGISSPGNATYGMVIDPNDANYDPPSRRFFAIYSDGSHKTFTDNNSATNQQLPTWCYLDNIDNEPIQFLYVTYEYEDDDPNAFTVDVNNVTSCDPGEIQIATCTLGYIGISHQDIVHGDDIVLRIPRNTASLCYHRNNGAVANGLTLTAEPFIPGTTSNTFFQSATSTLAKKEFDGDNCLKFSSPMNIPQYINFNCHATDDLIGDEIEFQIIKDAGRDTITQIVPVHSMFHDPNYVQVKCIWMDDNGEYWVQYRIGVYNEAEGPVETLSMELQMPTAIDISTIKFGQYQIGGRSGSGYPMNKENIGNGAIRIQFPNGSYVNSIPATSTSNNNNSTTQGASPYSFSDNSCMVLSGYHDDPNHSQMYSAYVEFCAKVDLQSQSIHDINLQPTSPLSFFESTPFVIYDFFDPKFCAEDSIILAQPSIDEKPSVENTICISYERPISDSCDTCNYCQTWLCKIWQSITQIFS